MTDIDVRRPDGTFDTELISRLVMYYKDMLRFKGYSKSSAENYGKELRHHLMFGADKPRHWDHARENMVERYEPELLT